MKIIDIFIKSVGVYNLIFGFCFIIFYYIYFKNKYILNLSNKIIIKKYKILITLILLSPLIVFFLKIINISNYVSYFIIPNFILFFLGFFLITLCKKLSFYDTTIYFYVYIFIFLVSIDNRKNGFENSEVGYTFIIFCVINIIFITFQSVIEIVIMSKKQNHTEMKNPETVNEIYNQISIRSREIQDNLKKYNDIINFINNKKQ